MTATTMNKVEAYVSFRTGGAKADKVIAFLKKNVMAYIEQMGTEGIEDIRYADAGAVNGDKVTAWVTIAVDSFVGAEAVVDDFFAVVDGLIDLKFKKDSELLSLSFRPMG